MKLEVKSMSDEYLIEGFTSANIKKGILAGYGIYRIYLSSLTNLTKIRRVCWILVGVLILTVGISIPVSAHSGVTVYSSYTSTPPTIDGKIFEGEWKGEPVYGKFYSNIEKRDIDFYVKVMNDDKYLYILLVAWGWKKNPHMYGPEFGPKLDFVFYFDVPHDGKLSPAREDYFSAAILTTRTDYHYDGEDPNNPWKKDIDKDEPKVSHSIIVDPNRQIYKVIVEARRKINTGNLYDLESVKPGDTVGFCIGMREGYWEWGKSTYYYNNWPSGSNVKWDIYPNRWADLVLAEVPNRFPVISIATEITPSKVLIGDTVYVSLTVKNVGSETAENVKAKINVPSGLSLQSGFNIVKNLGSIPPNSTVKASWLLKAEKEGSNIIQMSVKGSNFEKLDKSVSLDVSGYQIKTTSPTPAKTLIPAKTTTPTTQYSKPSQIPGFELLSAIAGLLSVAYFLKRKS